MPKPSLLKQHFALPNPPPELEGRVFVELHRAILHRIYRQLALSLVATSALLGVMAVSWSDLMSELSASSFGQFVQLMFTDPDIFFAHVKDTLLALFDALPLETLILSLTLALFIGWSIQYSWRWMDARREPALRLAV